MPLVANAGDARDVGPIPGSGRSPGEGNIYPLQYSGLENSMDYTEGLTESDMTEQLSVSAFFVVQLSHPYMTTRKTITLTGQIFVSKVMSLLF